MRQGGGEEGTSRGDLVQFPRIGLCIDVGLLELSEVAWSSAEGSNASGKYSFQTLLSCWVKGRAIVENLK